MIRICRAISEETKRNRTQLDHKYVVTKLNQMMNGWANYFCLGSADKANRAIELHARKRLRQWLCIKHKAPWPAFGVSSRKLAHHVWACPSYSAEAQLFVSELVTFPPGAGSGKSACPV